VYLCRACRFAKRLGHLLGCDRLVRRARRVHMATLGMVGSRARVGSTTNEMAIPLASAVRLSRRDGRISLHALAVVGLDSVVVSQIFSRNSQHFLNLADACWRRARFGPVRASVARDS